MAQFLRPNSNKTFDAGWTGSYTDIDEVSASDADYIRGPQQQAASSFEVGVQTPAATPGAGTGTIHFRIAKGVQNGQTAITLNGTGDTMTVTPALYQGTTLIAAGSAITATGAWVSGSISGIDLSAITDWSDLRIRCTSAGSGGGIVNYRRCVGISWEALEVPDAAAGIGNVQGNMMMAF